MSGSDCPSSACQSSGGRSSSATTIPTWLTGLLVTARIAGSASERPRTSHRSPVAAVSRASPSCRAVWATAVPYGVDARALEAPRRRRPGRRRGHRRGARPPAARPPRVRPRRAARAPAPAPGRGGRVARRRRGSHGERPARALGRSRGPRALADAASGAPAREVQQPAEDALAVGAQAVVVVLAGEPRPEAADGGGGLLGEGALDVHVLAVDRRGDGDLVGGQAVG